MGGLKKFVQAALCITAAFILTGCSGSNKIRGAIVCDSSEISRENGSDELVNQWIYENQSNMPDIADEKSLFSAKVLTPLPFTANSFNFRDELCFSGEISEVLVSAERDSDSGEYYITLYFSGRKTYDVKIGGKGRPLHVRVGIYDRNSGFAAEYIYASPAIAVGGTFERDMFRIPDRLPEGNYIIGLF